MSNHISTTRRHFLSGAALLAAWPTNLLAANNRRDGEGAVASQPGAPWENANGEAADAIMARRLHLDLAGRIPTADEARKYATSTAPRKREELVDRLLATPEFANFWAMRFCDILRVKSEFPINLWPNAVYVYHARIRRFVETNESWDAFGRALLTSQGSDFRDAEANFFRATDRRNPEGWAEATAQTFLGIAPDQLDAQRRQRLAKFFANVRIKETREWKEEIVYVEGPDRRGKLCDQLFGAGRAEVAEAFRRRIRAWIFGPQAQSVPAIGDPGATTSMSSSTPLCLKSLLREIVLSAEYARGSVTGGFPARRLDAETLDDALRTLSHERRNLQSPAPEPFTFLPPNRSTVCVEDGSISNAFLTLFGRPARDTGLPEERGVDVTAKQRLYLFNSAGLHTQLGRIVTDVLNAVPWRPFPRRIEDLYWTLLGRAPSESERQTIMQLWRRRGGANPRLPQKAMRGKAYLTLHDVAWCLVNTKEFLYRV